MTEKTCDILDDMAQNGFIDSDISHKHIDHIMGIIWMIRMICQHMRQGAYDGEAVIYGHADIFHPYEKHHSTVKDACELAGSSMSKICFSITQKTEILQKEKNCIQRKESGIIMAICMCRMIWKKYHYKDENGGCL